MYYSYNGIKIYYEEYKTKKKSIVILPGWGDNRKSFNYMINFLKDYFSVYILDYPGFGNSVFPNKDLTIYDYSLLIYNWIKYLDLDNPILIGHSFGGRIIITLLGFYNYKFSNIILMNSAGIKKKQELSNIIHKYSYKLLKLIRYILPNKYKDKYMKYLFNKFASNDYKNLSRNMMNTFKNIVNEDLKNYLRNINSKVLLLWGDKDIDTPVSNAYIINKLINNSELIVLKGCSHFTYLQCPILINKIIYEELKEEIK